MSREADYDAIAPCFDRRYAQVDYRGIEAALREFVPPAGLDVLEVGCGTGHWLRCMGDGAARRVGIDLSAEMLSRARATAPGAGLARARAGALPCRDRSFDRVFCINAFHHFSEKAGFLLEARRVLRSGGSLMILGLDPHVEPMDWWVYDHFPGTRARDRARYPSSPEVCRLMQEAGFVRVQSRVAQEISEQLTVDEAEARGLLDKTFTSQLSILTDEEYAEGRQRLRERRSAEASGGSELRLRTRLALHATVGHAA